MCYSEEKFGFGWLPDYPDLRDYTEEQKDVSLKLKQIGVKKSVKEMVKVLKLNSAPSALPSSLDLRAWCSPIENQGSLSSCTAQAGVGLVEYFERRAFGKHIDASRLFLYKVTRNLLKKTGDYGAYLRTTMQAMVLFGVPSEEYWPYTDKVPDFDKEPSAFLYAYAQNYQTIQYFRLDPVETGKDLLLMRIKKYLSAGIPSMFGFSVYSSYREAEKDGKIPFPCKLESYKGGHAVVAIGYDDKMEIENNHCKIKTKGALLIRNSWGEGWGDKGYGWLPYEYVLKGLAIDWWVLLKQEWIDSGVFGL